jgi:hypothetical protein
VRAVAGLLFVAACGAGDSTERATCDINAPGTCIEYSRSDDAARDACAVGGNTTFEPNTICPIENKVGGCLVVFSGPAGQVEQTTWFYPAADRNTEAEIRDYCTAMTGEYVPPDG